MKLYARAWHLNVAAPRFEPTEAVHAQLWNKGSLPIRLKAFNAIPTSVNGPVSLVAGTGGNGDPNQAPLDGSMQRLHWTIVDFGAGGAGGVNGGNAQSLHGEMRAQISNAVWQLGQAWHFHVSHTTAPISALDGLEIPPGYGFMMRAGNPGISFNMSFSWWEPT
jgi:hypothetical protein